ncbi:Hypothetical protein NTJ_11834 [Nesidiocoris tenuis]|uniref:Helix-turn-helix domain-containing protein n=1 Tax=Nesidiocoris tenuis TaxID=355587 RepID=A0ABN7B489_9HEMI|nr:Hypothetical protein NTJ_11834 [Nesidiocoris tenuis]
MEENGCLPFLDVMVFRDDQGTISTDWYRKKCSSDRCLDFMSVHAFSMKVASAKELTGRVLRLSSPQFHNDNKKKILDILRKNGYPKSLSTRIVHGWSPVSEAAEPRVSEDDQRNVRQFSSVTFVPGISPKLKVLLERECPEIRAVFSYKNKIGQLHTKLKAKDPIGLQSNVVYCVPCHDCQAVYIGQTMQYVKVRMGKHRWECQEGHGNGTQLSQHALTHDHHFNFEDVRILDREENLGRRLIKEMAHIKMNPRSCNARMDSNGLSSAYSGVLAECAKIGSKFGQIQPSPPGD